MRTERLDIMNAAMEADPEVRIKYSSKAAYIANAWKKWQGESLGLERLGTLDKKRAYEERFEVWTADHPEYAGVLDRLQNAYDTKREASIAADFYMEGVFAIELIQLARDLATGIVAGRMPDVKVFYKNYDEAIDRKVACALVNEFVKNVSPEFTPVDFAVELKKFGGVDGYVDYIFDNSVFTSEEGLDNLMAGREGKELEEVLWNDPAMEFYGMFADVYLDKIAPVIAASDKVLQREYRTYMRGQMAFEPERNFYPDANLTLRVAYGSVEGYEPEDGVWHKPFTTLEGIIAKDNPEIYDYDVPEALRQCHAEKDYGRWAVNMGTEENPVYTVPVAFLATNHTTGGNSGSPVLNGDGELVGINFDRTWLSTMSDLEFDPAMCRNISVDIRYVLFVIDRIGGAGYLFDEMSFN